MNIVDSLAISLGEEKIRALVAVFYGKVRQDDLIGPMYPPDDWEGAQKRLADFLVYRFGGSPTYLEERGHPRLRARHFAFPIGPAERDRWVELMTEAMRETGIGGEEGEVMSLFFLQVAESMRNRD